MIIKEVKVNGFKSYDDTVIVGPFDPGFNIVVGRNGAGKSNLFSAIEYVLDPRPLRQEARQALVHNGRKAVGQNSTAFVEIVFDNSDRKLPVENDMVSLKRVLGLKKDQFYCNNKLVGNVKEFLDSAGFSNPYFIVKQGKVQELAAGSDAMRLKVLKDAAGLTSFSETQKNNEEMQEKSEIKLREAEEGLTALQEKKASLENEASELEVFLKCDSKRRSLEFILNEREQRMCNEAVEQCKATREDLNEKLEPIQQQLLVARKKRDALLNEVRELEGNLRSAHDGKQLAVADVEELVSHRARLKNQQQDICDGRTKGEPKRTAKRLKELQQALDGIANEIAKGNEDLDAATAEYTQVETKEIQTNSTIKFMEERLTCGGDIPDAEDRIVELNKRIKLLESQLKQKTVKLQELVKEQLKSENEFKQSKKTLDQIRADLSEITKNSMLPETNRLYYKKQQSDAQKELSEVEHLLSREKDTTFQIIQKLRKTQSNVTVNGWINVKTTLEHLEQSNDAADREAVKGYFGTVGEIMSCDEGVFLAVEAVAAKKLFYHVVKDANVGRRILNKFNQLKFSGAVNFIPLREVYVREDPKLPADNQNYRPLLETIEYPEELEKAIKFVFGSVLLCRDLSDAVCAAKTQRLTCVTTEGDKILYNGPISGGYMRSELSLMELIKSKIQHSHTMEELQKRQSELEEKIQRLNSEIEVIVKQEETVDTRRCRLINEREKMEMAIKLRREKILNGEACISSTKKDIECINRNLEELKCSKDELERYVSSSSFPQTQRDRRKIVELKKQHKNLLAKKSEASKNKLKQEAILMSLKQRQSTLVLEMEEEAIKASNSKSSQEMQNELDALNRMIEEIDQQISEKQKIIAELDDNIHALSEKIKKQKQRTESLQQDERKIQDQATDIEKKLEKCATEVVRCNEQLQKVLDAATKLGTVPSGMSKYANQPSKRLYKDLKTVNRKLTDVIPTVNKKAAEQYLEVTERLAKFTEDMDALKSYRAELDELLHDMERKKADFMVEFFKVLGEQFEAIFTSIVPSGNAKLILYGENFEAVSSNTESLRRYLKRANELYGLKISANFSSRNVNTQSNVLHFSGGQKSVIALCLILAVQKVDPVPFYLFDEVDQALDPEYRTAVAAIIRTLADEHQSQFICTTFRKEFLPKAHCFFGVSSRNRRSYVDAITLEDAYDFIENDAGGSGSMEVDSQESSTNAQDNSGSSGGDL